VLTFLLTVNDTRFDSNATTTVTLTQLVDTDGDGLSDTEETTGLDNVLTAANPNGKITNPSDPDTDHDGASDGDEAVAGTDPTDATSNFRVTSVAVAGGGCTVEWTAVAGKVYELQSRDALTNPWLPLTNISATVSGVTNVVDNPGVALERFYRVRVLP
jgi:hypothetical protein